MLIEIINFDEEDISSNDKISSLDNILSSHIERSHIVISNKKQLEVFSKCSNLSINAQKAICEMHDVVREYRTLLNELSVMVKVDFSCEQNLSNIKENDRDIIIMSFDYFSKTMMVQPTTLIAENDTDFDMYAYIAEGYIKSNSSFSNLKFSFQKNCGYGSHTFKVYSDYKERNRFAFCIVDSDRKYPDAQLGSTAGQFSRKDFSVTGTVEANLLAVRELESLIPLNVLEELISTGDYPSSSIDILDKVRTLDENSGGIFRKYFDHKDGIILKDALKPKAVVFWKAFFNKEQNVNIKDCFKSNKCNECGNCIEIKGFGDKILDKSLSYMKESNKRKLFLSLPDSLKNEWMLIGKKAFSWGCIPAGRKDRA